jgi:hypothetical protein
MTVAEQIKLRVNELDSDQQSALLKFLESMEMPRSTKSRPVQKRRPRKSEVDAAIRAIAGMWKDRTDLPKDGAAASKILRRRLMGRNLND